MILLILGIVDVMVGLVLAFFGMPLFSGNNLILYLGIFMLIKGVVSYLLASANNFYFDLMGIVDLVAGGFLLLLFYGVGFFFFPYLGILVVIKGLYSSVVWLSSTKS